MKNKDEDNDYVFEILEIQDSEEGIGLDLRRGSEGFRDGGGRGEGELVRHV